MLGFSGGGGVAFFSLFLIIFMFCIKYDIQILLLLSFGDYYARFLYNIIKSIISFNNTR